MMYVKRWWTCMARPCGMDKWRNRMQGSQKISERKDLEGTVGFYSLKGTVGVSLQRPHAHA